MLQSLCDTSPEVRQAAAYGVGVMAQYGGETYRPFCTGMSDGRFTDLVAHDVIVCVCVCRGHSPAGRSHPGCRLALQGERQRYRELHLCCGESHEVSTRVRQRQRDPSPLAQLVTAERGQRGGCAHVRLPG